MRNNKIKLLSNALICLSCLMIVACASQQQKSRYVQRTDSAPTFEYGEISFVEPAPVYEPYNVWNSRPYELNGVYYTPMQTGKGFEQIGYASWYGQKFHGHKTANGEVFDMFELTAAHTTLPLPSFVRVTNLENGKQITVRVNDRGPFHSERILDLSYAAAKRLGFKDKGVAKVEIKVIHVDENGLVSIGKEDNTQLAKLNESTSSVAKASTVSVSPAKPLITQNKSAISQFFVQVLAVSDGSRARHLAKGLGDLLQLPTHTPKQENVYKLQIGPLDNEQRAEKVIKDLEKIGFEDAFTVILAPQ